MDRGLKAKESFEQGYTCSQSIVVAFSDIIGIDEKSALIMAQPFGAGMGRMREVCGTFSGIMLVLGCIYGGSDPKDFGRKKEIYQRVQSLAADFRRDNGSIICRELLGLNKSENTDPTPEARTSE